MVDADALVPHRSQSTSTSRFGNFIFRYRRDTLVYWYYNDLTKSIFRFIDIRKCQIKVHLTPHIPVGVAIMKLGCLHMIYMWHVKFKIRIHGENQMRYAYIEDVYCISYEYTWPQHVMYAWTRSARNVSMIQLARALKREYHFDEIFITGCTGSYLPVQLVIKILSKWRHSVSANFWIYLLVACREWTRLAQLSCRLFINQTL